MVNRGVVVCDGSPLTTVRDDHRAGGNRGNAEEGKGNGLQLPAGG